MKLNKTSLFLPVWVVVLLAPPLVHSKSPYAGSQGSPTRPTTAPTAPPVTPVSQGSPVQNPYKGNVGTTEKK